MYLYILHTYIYSMYTLYICKNIHTYIYINTYMHKCICINIFTVLKGKCLTVLTPR